MIISTFHEGVQRAINGEQGIAQDHTEASYAAAFTDAEHVLDWSLPGGFEQMVYAEGRFLLVREEETPRGPLRALAYELVPGKPPGKPQVVRPDDIAGRT